jgi:hypothetical protein
MTRDRTRTEWDIGRRAGAVAILLLGACGDGADFQPELPPGETNQPPAETADLDRGPEEAFPGRTGERRSGMFQTPQGALELEYEVIDGVPVFQGDILLPPEAGPNYRSTGVTALAQRWPYGVVPVENTGLFNDSRVTNAINHWRARAAIRFIFGATTGNRLRFVAPTDTGNCSSFVGMTGGQQTVNLGSRCDTGAAIHEIGHAIGLFHEQSRTDRANTVIVLDGTNGTLNCIQAGRAHNFAMFGNEGMNVGAYEIGSIMHYPSNAFATGTMGCANTMTRLNGTTFGANRSNLTGGDMVGAGNMYLPWTTFRRPVSYDHPFDSRHDFAVWRRSTATWFIINSSNGARRQQQWGESTDVPVPADYNNDFAADLAIWRPRTGEWWVRTSGPNPQTVITQWGIADDVPVPGDYNQDGFADRAVWRPSDGRWYIRFGNNARADEVTEWGIAGDIPVQMDWDGDGLIDRAIWRPSDGNWWILRSSDGVSDVRQWGIAGDVPVPGDYNGDGLVDFAVWRPAEGNWYVRSQANNATSVQQWGIMGDIPTPARFDSDGRVDFAVWRPLEGNWYVINSTTGASSVQQWGAVGDVPVP